jgi:bacterioferritin (cytochrome b1)
MSTTPAAAIIDALNSLLEAEHNSVCRFMGEGSPYLDRAAPDLRDALRQMSETADLHGVRLAHLIRRLGGRPIHPAPGTEQQYLGFLSLKFLLPKLADEKDLSVRRYDNTLAALKEPPPEVTRLLNEQRADYERHAEFLRTAAAAVLAAGR